MKNISIGIIRRSKYPTYRSTLDYNDNNEWRYIYKSFKFNIKKSKENYIVFTDFNDTKIDLKINIFNLFNINQLYQLILLMLVFMLLISYLFEITMGVLMGCPFLLYYISSIYCLYLFVISQINKERDFIFNFNKKSISYIDSFRLKHHLFNITDNVDLYIEKDKKNYNIFFIKKVESYDMVYEKFYYSQSFCYNSIIIKVPIEDEYSLIKLKEILKLLTGKDIIDLKEEFNGF